MNQPESPPVTTPPFKQPQVGLRWLMFAVALAGWVVSLTMWLWVANNAAAQGVVDAVCGPAGSAWDCSAVMRSRWGYWPQQGNLRIPVSVLGMAYFAFVGLWTLFIGPVTRGRGAYHVLLLAVLIVGLGQSLNFIRVMAFELHQWCTICLVAHGLNLALLGLAIAGWPWRAPAEPRRAHPTGRLALATVTAGLLAVGLHLAVALVVIQSGWLGKIGDAYRKITDDPAYILWDHQRQPMVDLPVRDDAVIRGNSLAAHTLVVFSDFQCTQCRAAHHRLQAMLEDHADRVRVVYRHFPQDPACNPQPEWERGGHPLSCEAARAYEAARIVGGAEVARQMRDRIYEQQQALQGGLFAEWAVEMGLPRDAFETAMASDEARQRVADDVALGIELGIVAVPQMYFDGRRLQGWSRPETWDALLDRAE